MSANKAGLFDSRIWLRSPENARISFLLIALVVLIKLPLSGSLWLDEGITAWITKDNLFATIDRATQFQGQSPLYFILAWIAQLFLGSSEFALRALSLVSVVGATLVIITIAKRFGGSAYGWIAGSFFLTIDSVQVAAISARPYGLALFFSLVAVWALFRWEERGTYRYSLVYLLSFLTSVYLQYLFAAMFAVHAIHVALHFRLQKVKLLSYATELLLVAALLFPAFLHIAAMSEKQAAWQFVPHPTAVGLLRALCPPVLVICAIGAIIIGALLGDGRAYAVKAEWKKSAWIGCWYLIPPVLMFALSLAGPTSLFLDRYFLFYTPAVALTFAAVPFIFKSDYSRAVTLAAFVALLLLREGDRSWKIEEWRSAAAVARRQDEKTPILVYSGLAESREIAWLKDENRQEYLTSPLIYYHVQNPTILLPPPLDKDDVKEYFEQIAGKQLSDTKKILFIGLEQKIKGKSTVDGWIERLRSKGFVSHEVSLGSNSIVRAVEFDMP